MLHHGDGAPPVVLEVEIFLVHLVSSSHSPLGHTVLHLLAMGVVNLMLVETAYAYLDACLRMWVGWSDA